MANVYEYAVWQEYPAQFYRNGKFQKDDACHYDASETPNSPHERSAGASESGKNEPFRSNI
jgi:hypothetical protein